MHTNFITDLKALVKQYVTDTYKIRFDEPLTHYDMQELRRAWPDNRTVLDRAMHNRHFVDVVYLPVDVKLWDGCNNAPHVAPTEYNKVIGLVVMARKKNKNGSWSRKTYNMCHITIKQLKQ